MMTKLDEAEEEATGGIIKGGATLTTLLGLRHIMLKNKPPGDAGWKDFRCVIHTETNVTIPGTGKDYMEGAKFTNNIGQDVVYWAANKRFEFSKSKFKFPRARTYELVRARSRLYRSQILQVICVGKLWPTSTKCTPLHRFWNPQSKTGEKEPRQNNPEKVKLRGH